MQDRTTVLIVDDTEEIRSSLAFAFDYEGYNVLTAGHGLAALDLLKSGHKPFLILLDVMMPYLDGIELLKIIRSDKDIGTPYVIMMSANHSQPNLKGANLFLRKPLDLNMVLELAADISAERALVWQVENTAKNWA